MLLIIYIILIFSGIILRKNKIVNFFIFIFSWILFGWSYGNADYMVHYNRFYNYNQSWIISSTEPLFTLLMRLFNNLNFTYERFLIIISFVLLSIYFVFVKKNSKNINLPIILYLLFPFCIDVCQIRFFIAGTIIYVGLNFLINEEVGFKLIVKYAICVIISAMFHYSTIFLLVLILPKIMTKKKINNFTIMFNVIMFFLVLLFRQIRFPGESNFSNKINSVLDFASKYNGKEILKAYFRMIVFFIGYYVTSKYAYKILLKNSARINENCSKELELLELTQKINITLLTIFPFIFYSIDLYRIQFLFSLLNYVSLTNCILDMNYEYKYIINKNNATCMFLIMIYSIMMLVVLVLSNPNIYTVFYPLFFNNLLIH